MFLRCHSLEGLEHGAIAELFITSKEVRHTLLFAMSVCERQELCVSPPRRHARQKSQGEDGRVKGAGVQGRACAGP